MKKKLFWLSGFSAVLGLVTPLLVSADQIKSVCTGGPVTTAFDLLCKFQLLLNAVIPFLIALGAVYFVWGVVQYVVASEEEAKKKGRSRMIYGLIGLVIIFAMWGLVGILVRTLGTNNSTPTSIPCVPGVSC